MSRSLLLQLQLPFFALLLLFPLLLIAVAVAVPVAGGAGVVLLLLTLFMVLLVFVVVLIGCCCWCCVLVVGGAAAGGGAGSDELGHVLCFCFLQIPQAVNVEPRCETDMRNTCAKMINKELVDAGEQNSAMARLC